MVGTAVPNTADSSFELPPTILLFDSVAPVTVHWNVELTVMSRMKANEDSAPVPLVPTLLPNISFVPQSEGYRRVLLPSILVVGFLQKSYISYLTLRLEKTLSIAPKRANFAGHRSISLILRHTHFPLHPADCPLHSPLQKRRYKYCSDSQCRLRPISNGTKRRIKLTDSSFLTYTLFGTCNELYLAHRPGQKGGRKLNVRFMVS